MEAYVSTFKQCVTTDLIHSGLPRSQAGLQALTERTKHITSYHNIHAYVQNQICPLLHLLNTTLCHHCTYTQEISISSTLHVLSSVPVSFTRCLWTISSECEGLAGGGGEEVAYMWARDNTQVTMTWEKRYAHNNIQEHTCISTATLHVLAQPL